MKKVLFTLAMLVATSGAAFAQKGAVKEAKKIASSSNPNWGKVNRLLKQAKNNPETKNDPLTWDIAGMCAQKRAAKQTEKMYLRQKYDTAALYWSVNEMFISYKRCDDLAQKPNKKGKIKNKYRKANVKEMLQDRGQLINGGWFFLQKKDFKSALNIFTQYVASSNYPMLKEQDAIKNDTLLPEVAFFAAYSAFQIENWKQVVRFAPYAMKDAKRGKDAYEYSAHAYKQMGDTVKFLKTLKDGIKQYPTNKYFSSQLVGHYSEKHDYDSAIQFAEELISANPGSAYNYYIKSFILLEQKKRDLSVEAAQKAVELDPKLTDAFIIMGNAYLEMVQDILATAPTDPNDPKYKEIETKVRDLYTKAAGAYESVEKLMPNDTSKWAGTLYRIYYSLRDEAKASKYEALQ